MGRIKINYSYLSITLVHKVLSFGSHSSETIADRPKMTCLVNIDVILEFHRSHFNFWVLFITPHQVTLESFLF